MTHISHATVVHLAQLSRLQLSDNEVEVLADEISNILGYVEQLDELDTGNVEPTYQVTGLENVWRDDTVETDIERSALLGLAPEAADNQVKVPKVL